MSAEVKRAPEWRANPGPQTAFLECDAFEACLGGAAGGGKMLPLDTMLPTPFGWVAVDDVHPGDTIFGEHGQPVKVVEVHPVDLRPMSYELEFDDGSKQKACANHLWLTYDAKELSALTRRRPEWRAARRERRSSRLSGRKSEKFSARLVAWNKANLPATIAAPNGTVRTTAEIAATLRTKSGRVNHAIPVAGALVLPDADLPIDPYLLGLWLGDGTTMSGSVTTADIEVIDAFRSGGYEIGSVRHKKGSRAVTFRVVGFTRELKALGLIGDKHIPGEYLRSSRRQRLALLRGLMDSDGYASKVGNVEFCSTRQALARGVHELAVSLGWKATMRVGRAKLYGVDCGPKYIIKWTPSDFVFLLKRKRSRQKLAMRRTTRFRYIVSCELVDPVPMRCITVDNPTGLYLAGESMIPTHNTQALIAAAARFVHEPSYKALLMRRTTPELDGANGLVESCFNLYSSLGGSYLSSKRVWTFPGGARIDIRACESERDVRAFGGWEIQFLGIDELTTFSEPIVTYLLSRLRTVVPSIPCLFRSATNPGGVGADWVLKRFRWWLYRPGVRTDEFGGPYALPGQVACIRRDPDTGRDELCRLGDPGASTRAFFPALVRDNPYLAGTDYEQRLDLLDPLTRRQLKEGDWMARAVAGSMFRREWLPVSQSGPQGPCARVRYWDRAGTAEAPGKDPDWTAGVLMARDGQGRYWVEDVARARLEPAGVYDFVRSTALADRARDQATVQVVEQDPGQAGKADAQALLRVLEGCDARVSVPTGSKVVRAQPLSAACAPPCSNVTLVAGAWNLAFTDELEHFPVGGHDDMVDAASGAFAWLARTAGGVGYRGAEQRRRAPGFRV